MVHVNDLVDNVTLESEISGARAAEYALGKTLPSVRRISLKAGENIRYIVPQTIDTGKDVTIYMRVKEPAEKVRLQIGDIYSKALRVVKPSEMLKVRLTLDKLRGIKKGVNEIEVSCVKKGVKRMAKKHEIICIRCPLGCRAELSIDDEGNVLDVANTQCKEGKEYAIAEYKSPVRVLTATVLTKGSLKKLLPVKTSKPIHKTRLMDCMHYISKVRVEPPIKMGQVIVSNILNLGADLVSTDELKN